MIVSRVSRMSGSILEPFARIFTRLPEARRERISRKNSSAPTTSEERLVSVRCVSLISPMGLVQELTGERDGLLVRTAV